MVKFGKIRNRQVEIEPDEIFLDSQNMPDFDVQQFEGRIEKPISKKSLFFLGGFFVIVLFSFILKVVNLQIFNGKKYFEISQNIILEKGTIFAERGIIYDRNNVLLAWNDSSDQSSEYSNREYIDEPGFSHLVGYVSYPIKDKAGYYWQKDLSGKDGVEKEFNNELNGQNGEKLREVNVRGQVQSENVVYKPKSGNSLVLTVDSKLQNQLYNSIKDIASNSTYQAGSGVIMDAKNGEVLALTNYPEYEAKSFTEKDNEKINQYLNDDNKPLLNRAVSGLYSPGSIVKPFFALGALNEGVIDPLKKILSTGSISIQNPYFPDLKTIFKDWRVQGWVDMRTAIAVSSDVYFYEIGGGFEDQKGLGIANLEKYARLFGIGEETGIDLPGEINGNIPNPAWKNKIFKEDWRLGDTYHTAIGQYGFQVTPIQMARAVSAIANDGQIFKPKIVVDQSGPVLESKADIDLTKFKVVKEGMRRTVTAGTAVKLNFPFVKIAAKTGSAQLGLKNQFINSWVVGFFPYEDPKYVFVVLLEKGDAKNNPYSATDAMKEMVSWMNDNTPDYFKMDSNAVEDVQDSSSSILDNGDQPASDSILPANH